jgi:DNA-directed RNA polymerase specialized sigma24 family protein
MFFYTRTKEGAHLLENKQQSAKHDQLSETEILKTVYQQLLAWTIKRHCSNLADAQEVLQEAIKQFINAGGNMADSSENLLNAIRSRINGVANNRRRHKASKAVNLSADGTDPENDDDGLYEERLVDNDWIRKSMDLLLDRIGNDDILFSMLEKMTDGFESPAEIAEALKVDVKQIYNASRRLNSHVAAVKARMES